MPKPAATTIHRLPITKARINLGAVAKRAHLAGEYFILEKDGIPIAGLMDANEMEDYLESRDPRVREHIRRSHSEFLAGKHRPAEDIQLGPVRRTILDWAGSLRSPEPGLSDEAVRQRVRTMRARRAGRGKKNGSRSGRHNGQ